MGGYVAVESFEALKRLRTTLCRFADLVAGGLGEAEAELHRTINWVRLEQRNYWKRETAKRTELLARAKSALALKRLQHTAASGRPSCVEEEKALALAKRRLEEAEQKQANVGRWGRRLDEEAHSYQAAASGLHQALSLDIPNALAQLDNMLAALEAYAPTAAPQAQGSLAPAGEEAARAAETPESIVPPGPPPTSEDTIQYRSLRAQTPPQALRDALPLHESNADRPPAGGQEPEWAAAFAGLGLACQPVALPEKIVMARGAARQPRIYLERLATAIAGDSGWYLGIREEGKEKELEAARVADVVMVRPEIAPLLALPPGFLAVLDGTVLEAVLDAEDKRRWPGNRGASP